MATMTAPEAPPQEDEGPPHDEEGLLLHYDVILCGTGLVQSMLASALTRAGKSVLHCDGNDYYGEYDAVVSRSFDWTQSQEETLEKDPFSLRPRARIQLHSTETLKQVPIQVGTELSTPYGIGDIFSLGNSVAIQLKAWQLANGTSPMLYVGIPSDVPWDEYLQLHMTPTRLLQAQLVLEQQRDFAFDLTPFLLYASGPAVQALLTSGVAEYMEFKPLEGLLWYNGVLSRVPCSKGDVFGTSLLSPLEKRRLMKFLQLTLDYALAQQQTDIVQDDSEATAAVESLNENHLNQGRALARPQNKAIATSDLQLLQDNLEMPFADYLSQHAMLSSNLIQLVRHALTLEPSSSPRTTRQGMLQLCQHVKSLGRYGTTAFLVPLYGSGELSQSFCRSAAVHGATYLLRRAPKRVVVQENKVQGILLNREDDEGEKMIPCDHVVVGAHAISSSTKKRLWRRISIVQGRLLQDQEQQRHVLIVPPGELGNPCAIHGLVLDHTVHVAPRGCTMLHLTTTADNDKDADTILEQVVAKLKAEEIYHVSFSYAIPDEEEGITNVDGLKVCQTSGQSLTLDAQVEQAKNIFQSICPDVEFLTMSREMDNIVKERSAGRDDEEDEDRMVLESAMNMMEVDAASERRTDEKGPAIDDSEDSVVHD
jgi:RAB protein geranylgeranyltransferase component A